MQNPPRFQGTFRVPPFPARAPVAVPQPRQAPSGPGRVLGYFLFILVNATLFVRPGELLPELEDFFPSYEILIIVCFLVSFPYVYRQLSKESLKNSPITVCVLGLMIAVILSQLFSPFYGFPFLWGVRVRGFLFLKILIYYLLLVGLLDTPGRVRFFLASLAVMIVILVTFTLLGFHGMIDNPRLMPLQQRETLNDGTIVITTRLQSLGIYNDPNDLCMILVIGMGICLYLCNYPGAGILGWLWITPVGFFGYAVYLTKSRGGFMAMLAGMLVLFHARFGLLRTVLLSTVVLPLMFFLFGGRQTTISTNEDSAVTRLQLWSEGLGWFRQYPLFGMGLDEFTEREGEAFVPHNSYIHCYAELGFFGGTLFLGAYYYAIWALYRIGSSRVHIFDPEQRRLRPYIIAFIVGYATSMLTLSRIGIVPTYMVLGLGMMYLRSTALYPPLPELQMSKRLVRRLVLVSAIFVVVTYVYVRTNVTWH